MFKKEVFGGFKRSKIKGSSGKPRSATVGMQCNSPCTHTQTFTYRLCIFKFLLNIFMRGNLNTLVTFDMGFLNQKYYVKTSRAPRDTCDIISIKRIRKNRYFILK